MYWHYFSSWPLSPPRNSDWFPPCRWKACGAYRSATLIFPSLGQNDVTPMPPNLRFVVDGASHSAIVLRSLWFHRHVTRCLARTWTAAAWFITQVGVGRSQTLCPVLHRPSTGSAVYASVIEACMNIYHCFLPQPFVTRQGARPEWFYGWKGQLTLGLHVICA